jgi:hypoxanthine phosphoribosyltransferase
VPEPPGPVPEVVLDRRALSRVVARVAAELDRTHDDATVLISTLKGGMIFASDLLRQVRFHPVFDVVAVTPFEPGTRASMVKRPDADLAGARVVLVTDVIDTGLSLQFVLDELSGEGPESITVCTLVDKPHRRLVPVPAHHVGIEVGADFLIGYGLDFAGWYRNVPVLAAADLDRLAADPGCYRSWAYGNRDHASEGGPPSG